MTSENWYALTQWLIAYKWRIVVFLLFMFTLIKSTYFAEWQTSRYIMHYYRKDGYHKIRLKPSSLHLRRRRNDFPPFLCNECLTQKGLLSLRSILLKLSCVGKCILVEQSTLFTGFIMPRNALVLVFTQEGSLWFKKSSVTIIERENYGFCP